MAGLLIVEGDETEPYDADIPIVLKDWRVDEADGAFIAFFTPEGAGKAGTFGTVRSANGATNPEIVLPAAGDCRLRLYNLDNTRVMQIGVEGAEAAIIAVDGVADAAACRCAPGISGLRCASTSWCARRRDGETARWSTTSRREPVPLVRLGGPRRAAPHGRVRPGAASRRAHARARPAERRAGALQVHRDGHGRRRSRTRPRAASFSARCAPPARLSGPSTSRSGRPRKASCRSPLATFQRGRSYILELQNLTPHKHPIHFHGHSFKVLSSNRRDIPVHRADTVLLEPKRAGGGGAGRRQSGRLDVPLPHHRAPGERHDGLCQGDMRHARRTPSPSPRWPPRAAAFAAGRSRRRARQGAVRARLGAGAAPRPTPPTGSGRSSLRGAAPAAMPGAALAARFTEAPEGRIAGPRACVLRLGDADGPPDPRLRPHAADAGDAGHDAGRPRGADRRARRGARLSTCRCRSIAARSIRATRQSLRLAPPLVGRAALERIDADAVAGLADPDDRDGDGISGRTRMIETQAGKRSAATAGRRRPPTSTSRSPTPSRWTWGCRARCGRSRTATARRCETDCMAAPTGESDASRATSCRRR